jgi:hypothetical protein
VIAALLGGPNDAPHGAIKLAAEGSFTFTPTPGFSGSATFTYCIADSRAQPGCVSPPATVRITVTKVGASPGNGGHHSAHPLEPTTPPPTRPAAGSGGGRSLASTGSNAALLGSVALALLAAGGLALGLGRRRSH